LELILYGKESFFLYLMKQSHKPSFLGTQKTLRGGFLENVGETPSWVK
jgi:hypothetical protein